MTVAFHMVRFDMSMYSKRWSDAVQKLSRHRRLNGDTLSGWPLRHTSTKTGDVLFTSGARWHSSSSELTTVAGLVKSW